MYWDRFDIMAAYYHYSKLNAGGVTTHQWACGKQLEDMRYRPGLSDSRLATISLNAKQIYMQLVRARFNR